MTAGVLFLVICIAEAACVIIGTTIHALSVQNNSEGSELPSYAVLKRTAYKTDKLRSENNSPISSKSYEEFMQQGAELIKKGRL